MGEDHGLGGPDWAAPRLTWDCLAGLMGPASWREIPANQILLASL